MEYKSAYYGHVYLRITSKVARAEIEGILQNQIYHAEWDAGVDLKLLMAGIDADGKIGLRLRYYFDINGLPKGGIKTLAKRVFDNLETLKETRRDSGLYIYQGSELLRVARDKGPDILATAYDKDNDRHLYGRLLGHQKPYIVLWNRYWREERKDRPHILFHEMTHNFIGTHDYAYIEWDSAKGAYLNWRRTKQERERIEKSGLTTTDLALVTADSYAGFLYLHEVPSVFY